MTLVFDHDRIMVTARGRALLLTGPQFRLGVYLSAHPGFVRSRNDIMDNCWPSGIFVDERTVDTLVRRLRAKLKELEYPHAIEARVGLGYAWREGYKGAKPPVPTFTECSRVSEGAGSDGERCF